MIFFKLFLFACFYVRASTIKTGNRPHIILIIADDLGWNDVGFHGSNQIPTPNIDALAYNGIILNRFYTLPSCTPSRAALLTGQYPIRLGLQGLPMLAGEIRHLPFEVPTLPEKLQELGYKTHLVGKWHLGAAFKNITPTHKGFDSHFGYWNGYIGYFNHEATGGKFKGLDMHDDLEPSWHTQGQYATHLFTKKAEDVIRKHNVDEPLFLMLSHLAGHSGKNGISLEVPNIDENNKKFSYIKDENRRLYAGMIDELDKSVGQIMEALSGKGILNDSIVMFISDNGAATTDIHGNSGSNWPLRGLRLTVLEGGVRNVGILYSSLFKNTGYIDNQLIHITDLLPTIYAAAGGNVQDLPNIDGINQWPGLMFNKTAERTETLLNIDETTNSSGFLGENGRFKLVNGSTTTEKLDLYYGDDGRGISNPIYNTSAVIHSPTNIIIGGKLTREKILQKRNYLDLGNCRQLNLNYDNCTYNNFCLFDLLQDPCETTNVAKDFPNIVETLKEKLALFWKVLKQQKPRYIDPRSNPIYYNNSWYTWLDNK